MNNPLWPNSRPTKQDVAASDSQGLYRRILCVCNGGINRSPTLAELLTQIVKANCRACGTESNALIKISHNLIFWADEIICLEDHNRAYIKDWYITSKPIRVLGIPDDFMFRDPELIRLLKKRLVL